MSFSSMRMTSATPCAGYTALSPTLNLTSVAACIASPSEELVIAGYNPAMEHLENGDPSKRGKRNLEPELKRQRRNRAGCALSRAQAGRTRPVKRGQENRQKHSSGFHPHLSSFL